MDTDIERLVRICHQCQVNQHSPPEVPIHPWRYPDTAWERLHVDYLGPFMNTMFLVVIDARTKWIELCPVSSASSETTVRKLRHIFSTHGLPLTIVSDNGTPFTGEEFQKFLTMKGIRHITSAPYHPASNELAERAVQVVKQGLRKHIAGNIQTRVDRFLFSHQNTPHA